MDVIIEEAEDQMLNEIHKFRFLPGAITALSKISENLDYLFVMVTNQDGLGTDTFPLKQFWPLQEMLVDMLANEGIHFDSIHIDEHYAHENSAYRKPGTLRLKKYLKGDFDLENSLVLGDRWSDMELAKNLGAKGILIQSAYSSEPEHAAELESSVLLKTSKWSEVYKQLIKLDRKAKINRSTNETSIDISINLDGSGISEINTGIGFYDHMLDQLSKHGGLDLFIDVKGDLEIDEHHTIEDTAIALGQVFYEALGKKAGITRYGYCLPMDDVLAQVAIDFGGRPWIEWDVEFKREMVGEMPTELVYHFFKSFSDSAKCNLNMKAEGDNEHHKIEALFKAWAKSIKMAIGRNTEDMSIPSTKRSVMIAIIDYKAGNTCSVQNALKRLNATFELTSDIERIRSADKVIFPGVGHAKAAMDELNDKELVPVIRSLTQPLLGICLGMQLLCAKSEESDTKCLNIIPLEVLRFDNSRGDAKVPHMGWNTLTVTDDPLFESIAVKNNHCYFVHSYYVPLSGYTSCKSNYIQEFSSGIRMNNFTGVQFHPEKSGEVGEQIIKNFLES